MPRRNISMDDDVDQLLNEKADDWDMTRSEIVNKAVREYVDTDKLSRLEDDVQEIKEMLEGSPSPSESDHTHTDSERVESDGGVAVETTAGAGIPSTTIDDLDEYDPEATPDFDLSRDALADAPSAVDQGDAINPDHVDYSICQSRGFPVAAKAAVTAGIIRYKQVDVASAEDIKDLAEDVLGNRRNARRHFDRVVAHFAADPLEVVRDELGETFIDRDELVVDVDASAVRRDDVFFVDAPALLEEHFQGRLEQRRLDVLEPDVEGDGEVGAIAKSQGALRFLRDRADAMVRWVFDGSRREFVATFQELADEHNQRLDDLDVDQFDPVERDPLA